VKSLCISILLAMLVTFDLQAGTLSATADRTQLSAGESLGLSVQYDSSTDEEPDTRALEQQFTIISRNKSSNIQIINGDISRATTWNYELSPRKSGTLLIPAFNINGDTSEAISIEVSAKNDNSANDSQQNIYTETTLDKDKVFVQQQVVVTWRLVSRYNISEPQFLPPQIDGVLVQDLGSRAYKRSDLERVIEQRYALFPQQSGNITIPPQQFQVIVDTPRRDNSGFFRPGRSQVRLSTEERTIEVSPADNPKNIAWLPASSLNISQEILGTNQNQQATAGIAFTRIIRMRSEGLSAEQLPPPDMQANGIKVYSEAPVLDNKDNQQGVIGLREDHAAIIAAQPGKLVLPAITIPWYDVDTIQWREAVLPATEIDVLPGATTEPTATNATNPAKTSPSQDNPVVTQSSSQQPAATEKSYLWQISTAVLFTLLLAVVIYIYRQQQRSKQLFPDNKTITGSPIRPSHNKVLQQAAEQGDLKKMHQEILAWAREQAANASALQHESVSPLLQSLEKHLYGNGAPPDRQAMTGLSAQLEKLAADHEKNSSKKPQLETLYR
jgi:hypothetical protein